MEALFRKIGIYSHIGQNYEPVDKESLLYYREAKDGQILEEGITEAGAMSSFIAAGTSYSTFGLNMIPFFFFYSMFGFQRIGDLIWARAMPRHGGSCWGPRPGAPPCPVKACSIRTATATCWPWPTPPWKPTIRPLPTRSPSSSGRGCAACSKTATTWSIT
jgi:hypothetical protein